MHHGDINSRRAWNLVNLSGTNTWQRQLFDFSMQFGRKVYDIPHYRMRAYGVSWAKWFVDILSLFSVTHRGKES
jgi:hypothetical protein